MERLFKGLKPEWVLAMGYRSIDEARKDNGLYLMDYYNRRRLHTANDGMAPAIHIKPIIMCQKGHKGYSEPKIAPPLKVLIRNDLAGRSLSKCKNYGCND